MVHRRNFHRSVLRNAHHVAARHDAFRMTVAYVVFSFSIALVLLAALGLAGCAVPVSSVKPRIWTLDGRTGEFYATAKVPVDLSASNPAGAN